MTSLRVFYFGAPSHINLNRYVSTAELLKETGNNTGNLLIGHAIKRHLNASNISSDFSLGNKYIEENFDIIVIGASNFIFPSFNFGMWADFLEAVKLPCIIIGLGAQAPIYGTRVEIPKGTERFLRIISERSVSLGVRGYYTAATLIEMGIKNVRVIGCPSMYWSCKPTMNLRWSKGISNLSVAINGSGNVVQHSCDVIAAKRVEAMLARLSYKFDYPYILQNELALMEIASGEQINTVAEPLTSLMERYGFSDISSDLFLKFVKKNMKTFFDVDEWIRKMGFFDFVLGSRFHGCLAALLAEVPCFMIVHDARTREMCELLKIPHTDVRKVDNIDINALYDSLDLISMQTAYRYLYQNYIQFLEENNVPHCLSH